MSKHDLFDMIITGKSKKNTYTQEDDDLWNEEVNNVLNNIKTSNTKL